MTPETKVDLVIIGGTGVYRLATLQDVTELDIETPFGPTSSSISLGTWCSRRVAFLARHGADHSLLPHQLNYRANVWALAELDPIHMLAINAVGSLNESLAPGTLVLPDQIIDYTWGREQSFATELPEVDLHIDFTEPYSNEFRARLLACDDARQIARTATMGVTQGPRLETAAEIRKLKRDGCDLVGMTGMPEASLARELKCSYACMAIVANWAAGLIDGEGQITMDDVVSNVEQGTGQLIGVMERFLQSRV